jgi:hypothetical protein
MKPIYLKCTLAAAAALVAGAAQANPADAASVDPYAAVYVRTDGLSTAVAARITQEAQKGLRPLRMYVERTKFIHQLDLISLLMTREQAQLAKAQDDKVQLVLIATN